MKRILYLTFYFEPDLSAGSFRNSSLIKELAAQAEGIAIVDVVTTLPNRYSTYKVEATGFEEHENYNVIRIGLPPHRGGMKDQIISYKRYFRETEKIISDKKYDLVVASSSRLFTAYLGYTIAKKQSIPLYLDIRDIFIDTLNDVIKSSIVKAGILPFLKIIERNVFTYATHINLISAGFRSYFDKFRGPKYSFFSNGIDVEFLNLPESRPRNGSQKLITYAGNIGEGQGLHKIIPQAAKRLGNNFKFLIIGDGGAKQKLVNQLKQGDVSNVEIRNPVCRKELLEIYNSSDYLFIHLNDYDAFKKVLPSKIFELGAYDKPIIAGVAGFAREFIKENIPNNMLFLPGDTDDMVRQLSSHQYTTFIRTDFIANYKRENINLQIANSILQYL